jgi:hypothetical protein
MFWLDTASHTETLISAIEVFEYALQPGLQMSADAATYRLPFPELCLNEAVYSALEHSNYCLQL